MIEVQVTPQDHILSDLMTNLEAIGTKVMPKTFKAVRMAAKVIAYTWKAYALGHVIPGTTVRIKNPTGAYARSIKIVQLSPFSVYVRSDSAIAEQIENGTKSYDMKKTHPFGRKSRVVRYTVRRQGRIVRKEGDSYLVVPFRHGVPGTLSYGQIPAQLYAKIRQAIKTGDVQLSRVVKGKKRSPNYKGELIPRSQYAWGTKISAGIDQLENLVVFDESTPQSKRSTYVTFRIISVNSPAHKWIQPGRAGLKLTEHVVRNTQEMVHDIISQGIKEDIGLA